MTIINTTTRFVWKNNVFLTLNAVIQFPNVNTTRLTRLRSKQDVIHVCSSEFVRRYVIKEKVNFIAGQKSVNVQV